MINQLNNLDNKKIKSFLSWFVFVFFIQLLTEAYSFIYIFYIFVIVYNISLIADKTIPIEESKNESEPGNNENTKNETETKEV